MIQVAISAVTTSTKVLTVRERSPLVGGGPRKTMRRTTLGTRPATTSASRNDNTRQGARSVPAGVRKSSFAVRSGGVLSRAADTGRDRRFRDVEGRELRQPESDRDRDRLVQHRQVRDAADEDQRDPRAGGGESRDELFLLGAERARRPGGDRIGDQVSTGRPDEPHDSRR